jgi:ribonuclease HII
MTGGMCKNQARVCGIDEVGRGPLAGPVVAAAVLFLDDPPPTGLGDSKKLSLRRRLELNETLRSKDTAYGLGWVWHDEIDSLNIHNATLTAMHRAWQDLVRLFPDASHRCTEICVDGSFVPAGLPVPAQAIVRGDNIVPEIMAASILAKVARDTWMESYGQQDRRYGFERHKGYPSAEHRQALARFGPCPIHRRSFRGVLPAPR